MYLVISYNKIDDMPEKCFGSERFALLQLLGWTGQRTGIGIRIPVSVPTEVFAGLRIFRFVLLSEMSTQTGSSRFGGV